MPATPNPTIIESINGAMVTSGIASPDDIVADSRVHMFAPDGVGTPRDAWYVLRADERPAGAFGCKRKGMEFALCPRRNKPAAKDHRGAELSSLRARLSAFSAAIFSAGVREDAEISQRYADFLLRTAERMLELGAQPGLHDPLASSAPPTERREVA